jgi:hypothetical protein
MQTNDSKYHEHISARIWLHQAFTSSNRFNISLLNRGANGKAAADSAAPFKSNIKPSGGSGDGSVKTTDELKYPSG